MDATGAEEALSSLWIQHGEENARSLDVAIARVVGVVDWRVSGCVSKRGLDSGSSGQTHIRPRRPTQGPRARQSRPCTCMAPSEFRSVSVQRLEVGVMGQERQYAPEKTADATEALAELGALLRAIRDKLEGSAKVLVLLGKPLKQWLGLDRILHLEPGRLVHELAAVELGLLGRGVDDDLLCKGGRHGSDQQVDTRRVGVRLPAERTVGSVAEDVARDIKVLPDDERLDGAHLQALKRVLNAKDKLAGVKRNLVKVLLDQALLLDKLDVRQRVGRELDGLQGTLDGGGSASAYFVRLDAMREACAAPG